MVRLTHGNPGAARTARRPLHGPRGRLGRFRRRANRGLPAGAAPLHRLRRLRQGRRQGHPCRALHALDHVRAAWTGKRRPHASRRRGLFHPRGQGQGLPRRRHGCAGGDGARQMGLHLLPRGCRPRLRERGSRRRLSPGDAGRRPAGAHGLRRSRTGEAERRASEAAARLSGHLPVGASIRRKEDGRLLRGAGRYTDDFAPPGMLWLAVVRSPHAHARITRIDRAAAARLPGVAAVLTRADLPECAGSIPPLVPAPDFPRYHHPVLAADRVMHAGEGVAVVVADSAYVAADAVLSVSVDYEPLPAAASVGAALAAGAPRVHDDWPGNLAGVSESATGNAADGFKAADAVVEMRLYYPRVAGMPIEPRAVLASHDENSKLLTVWLSTQVPFAVRSAIASALGMSEEHVRVIAPEVGGGFGVKGHVYPEDILVPAVARRLGRPVKWIETRREHFLTAAADRDQAHHARLGVSRDGAIVALETEFTRDHGAHTTLGEAITFNTINHLVGPYRVPHYRGVGRNVVTHKTFIAAYRGAGRPEANFVLDRLLDRAARGIGMDPAALRRRNMIRPD